MESDIKEKVGHLSPKVVIPIFIIVLVFLGVGFAYAYNPDNFSTIADSVANTVKDSTNKYLPEVAAKLGTDVVVSTTTFGGFSIPDEPTKNDYKNTLPDISKAVVMIYPTQTDKGRGNAGTPPVYVGKAIELDLSAQRMFIWENGFLVNDWLISSGREDKPTKQGNFKILDKMRWAYGSGGGDSWAMPYWMGFYWAGGTENGLHGLPLINGRKEGAGSLGHPVSHGCVRSGDSNQEWLYSWAEVGIPVIVHK